MNDKRFSKQFTTQVEDYMATNNLTQRQMAERMGISPQLLSEILNGTKQITIETKVTLLHFMDNQNTNDSDGLEQINAAVLRKFAANKHASIKYFQSGLGVSEDGFVPQEGKNEPDYAGVVAQLVRDGRVKEATELLVHPVPQSHYFLIGYRLFGPSVA
jgi:transcriptional regulator with XRE-family HTH domain